MITQSEQDKMLMEELRNSDWYKERPDVIKQAIEKLPPNKTL